MPPTTPSRRAVLVTLAGSVVAASGCTASDPRITARRELPPAGSPTGEVPSGMPTPTPTSGPGLAGARQGARSEQGAGAQAAALLRAGPTLNRRQRDLVDGIRAAHLAHAYALLSPDPTNRPAGSARPTSGPEATTLAALVRTERRLAARHLRAAVASRGPAALLWASLGVAAQSYAAALADDTPPRVGDTRAVTGRAPVVSDVAAQQAVVAAVHALIYGYQVAIGRLATGSGSHARAVAGLVERRALRDRLVTHLIEVEADVPVALPAYALPIPVSDAGSAQRLIRRMEVAFVPYLGQWVAAAARTPDRRLAVSTLASVAVSAERWGAPPQVWPGWA